MGSRRQGILFAILSSFLSSAAWIFQGQAVSALGPLIVAGFQPLLAGLIYLFVIVPATGRPTLSLITSNFKQLAIFVIFRGVLGEILICYALLYSPSIKVMFFTKLEPYLIIFWGWLLFRTKISRKHFWLLGLHVLAAIVLSTDGRFELDQSSLGDLLVVSAIVMFAFSYLQAAPLSQLMGANHLNGISNLISGIILLPLAVVGWLYFDSVNDVQGWWHLLAAVLLFNVFALLFLYRSLMIIPSWLSSALRAIGPILAAPLAYYFYGQTLSTLQIMAALVVVGTSALLSISRAQPK